MRREVYPERSRRDSRYPLTEMLNKPVLSKFILVLFSSVIVASLLYRIIIFLVYMPALFSFDFLSVGLEKLGNTMMLVNLIPTVVLTIGGVYFYIAVKKINSRKALIGALTLATLGLILWFSFFRLVNTV